MAKLLSPFQGLEFWAANPGALPRARFCQAFSLWAFEFASIRVIRVEAQSSTGTTRFSMM